LDKRNPREITEEIKMTDENIERLKEIIAKNKQKGRKKENHDVATPKQGSAHKAIRIRKGGGLFDK